MEYNSELIPRILRDIDDSVLALDERGRIIYMNPQCRSLLDLNDVAIGRTYAEMFFDEQKKENDGFHQFVIDAVYHKEKTHSGSVTFTDKSNKTKHLRVTSSFLKNEENDESGGVVLVLSDITETEILRKKRYDASIVFTCVTACVCLYLLVLATIEFLQMDVPTKALTQVINAMVFIFGIVIYYNTKLTFDELGLKFKNITKTIVSSVAISLGVVMLLMAAKFALLQIVPDFFAPDVPFWNWNIGLYSWFSYIFTCIIQEFLARSLIYGSIKKMFDEKNSIIAAILLSSLLFGAVHIAHGFMYMMAAMILLGALGGVYEKHQNIWGVTLIHFVLGQAACCLGFLS
ncbi:MAG: PAS domain-containing protein [Clostridia bacterium]|nr:PAS domain-containing protein [Clostridia bacterium]